MKYLFAVLASIVVLVLPALLLLPEREESKTFVALNDYVRILSPMPGDHITSPLVIKGEAKGYWYFEADFPVILTDWDGLIIAESHAIAQSEWMTEDFVPFEAVLEFTRPAYGERGTLILQKSNASGLPELDDAVEIGIYFGR